MLWIIGVDEHAATIAGARLEDLASWYPQVEAEFEGHAPSLLRSLSVVHEDAVVVGLLFAADHPPYVVRNRSGRDAGAGPATREVPYREGTATRSATRADLLRILAPRAYLPVFEAVNGFLQLAANNNHDFSVELYCMPRLESQVGLAVHRITILLHDTDDRQHTSPDSLQSTEVHSLTVQLEGQSAVRALTFHGPRLVTLKGTIGGNVSSRTGFLLMTISIRPALSDEAAEVRLMLRRGSHAQLFAFVDDTAQ